ncbi:YvcK family protein [Shinella sp. CPCC 101442]|uniref:gluconeogenesis factor YvcK family protein n=1 Tax=Shinella sp. CPCC 101442 TaxID=2932265 RepID=UPI0021526ED1|nr:gluconeogenesis factor YvcK family protein [Shinella sp. CPCC 101442]MCR6502221.1 YvcK family protein [Shinella sp. CPCC 101442]
MAADRLPHIVLFSGGTACRSTNLAFCAKPVRLTRIVPAWDSGGSSKVIRESLDVLGVGDIRQALMTMAHGEGRAGDVVKVCNARLTSSSEADAYTEFALYAEGRHPLLERMEPGLRGAILNYLRTFRAATGADFDFRNGSIGNFILTGAHLAHNSDINTAIFVFRKLCDIAGHVWPSTAESSVGLSAVLNDGTAISGQHRITALGEEQGRIGIREIALSAAAGASVAANEAVIESLESADVVVFGPGSFYTSVLPHLLVDGVVPAIARNVHARRVFIGNILQCRETRGLDVAQLLQAAAAVWRERGGVDVRPFTHVLANRQVLPFEKTVGAFAYLANGALEEACARIGAEAVIGEFEDPWQRGQHDGSAVADILSSLLPA